MASKKAIATKEKEHFLNLPESNADLEDWGRKPSWTINEAAALFLNKDPLKLYYEVAIANADLEIVRKFLGYRDSLKRAIKSWEADEFNIKESCPPINFIKYAEHYEIELQFRLKELVEKFAPRYTYWKKLYLEQKAQNDFLIKEGKDIQAKARVSIFSLLGGFAVLKYSEEKLRKKQITIESIRSELFREVGVDLDDQTLSKYIDLSLTYIPVIKEKL